MVTHYDTYFQNLKAQLSVGDIKKLIADTLSKILNLEVSENIIFPICGKWAVDVSRHSILIASLFLFRVDCVDQVVITMMFK